MINLRSLPLCVLAGALVYPLLSPAQQTAPAVRITAPIDESNLVTLTGNTLPAANAKNDRGPVSPGLPMTDLILVLSRSPQQQAAFDAFVASQNDPNSPNYHQWLTPQQVGELYGPSTADIATITNWLTGHGITVNQVTNDRMTIRFSGTAAQIESTFHTEIHDLSVNGVSHVGNMSDPQIPAALAPVVVGVKSLSNFFPHPLHHMGQTVFRNPQTGKWARRASAAAAFAPRVLGTTTSATISARPSEGARPQFGASGTEDGSAYTVEDVGPWDFATIYNVSPLWSNGIDGTGQTIAIAGTSAIDIGETTTGTGAAVNASGANDVATFRTFFDLPTNNSYNTPIQKSGNSQPLQVCTDQTGEIPYPSNPCEIGDLEENTLDVEWSGSVAKNAQIILVSSYPASTTDDTLYDSESYIVNNLTAHIMNVSYGECELGMGTGGNVEYYNLWETAASEGIAVFVAAGDAGSASCDDGGDEGGSNLPYAAEYGLTVSGLATTPFDTAVGGTDFNWCPLTSSDGCASEAGTYWNTTNNSTTEANAKGYVPEVPWNDTCTSPLALPFMKSFFSGVQYSGSGNQTLSVTDAETGCNAIGYYGEELEQDGDGVLLYLVDTVGGGGGASGCVTNDESTEPNDPTCTTGSTSTGTSTNPDTGASQAALTLVNNGWPKPSWQAGVSGIPSDGVRDIPDVSFFASDGFLSSSAYLICVSAATSDNECTYSNASEPYALEVGGTSVATPAMAGVMALIDQKTGAAQGSPNSELYTLAAKQNYGNCSAESASTGNGCYFNDIDTGTNAMACDYDAFVTTPSPNCTVAHAGDYFGILPGYSATAGYDEATGLGSLNVANVVNAWTASTGLATPTVTVTPQNLTINSSNSLNVTVSVSGSGAAPTGTVTLSGGGYASTTETIGTSPCASASNCVFTIPGNTLTVGTVTLTAAYSGDSDYAKTTSTAQVTVTQTSLLTPAVTVTPASQTLNSNASLNVTVSVSGSGATPTGTVTLSGGSYTSSAETIGTSPCTSNTSCVFTIPANTLASGTDTLTATYSGDSNYTTGTNTAQVTVTESTFTLTPGTPSSSGVTPGASATVAVTVASVAGYTGTVSLTCQQTSTTASGGDGTTCTGGGSSTAVTLPCSGTSCNVTFTIGTTAPTTAALERPQILRRGKGGWLGAGGGAVLAFFVFFGIPAKRRSWRSMLTILAAMVVLGGMSSCGGGGTSGTTTSTGGGGQSDPGTTAGTYTYTVTATPSPSVSPVVSKTFTVTVN
jgi:hypothetical protein